MFKQNSEQLVTIFGGAGYIGSLVTRLMLEQGFRVRVFDNFMFGDDGIKGLQHDNLEVITGDTGNVYQVSAAVKNCNIVIHLAELGGRRFWSPHVNAPRYRDVNYLASSLVLYAAKERGVERFIYASSDAVYGNADGLVYETVLPAPVTLHARLKLRMEESILRARTREFHPTVLRISTCYGYSPRMRFDLLPNALIRDAICQKQAYIENENSYRSYVHVGDVAKIISECAQAYVNSVSGEVFNVGTHNYTMTPLAVVNVVRTIQRHVAVETVRNRELLMDYRMSCRKLESFCDFTPTLSMREGLVEIADRILDGTIKDPYDTKYTNGNSFFGDEDSDEQKGEESREVAEPKEAAGKETAEK